jgi:hypothetical protein
VLQGSGCFEGGVVPLGKVLVTAGSVAGSAAALRAMRDAGCELLVQNSPSPFDQEWLLTQVRDVDGLIVAMEPLTHRVLDAAPRLAGIDGARGDVGGAEHRGRAEGRATCRARESRGLRHPND